MAIGLDNAHLQQHLIEKIQEQINQETTTKENEAKSSDVDTFKAQMGDREQTPAVQNTQTTQATAATNSVEKTGGESIVKSPGDHILEGLEGMSKNTAQINDATSMQSIDRMSVTEELKMQIQVTKLGAEESVLTSTSGKASKDVESLLKNQ